MNPQDNDSPSASKPAEVDTTAELWDRIGDDLASKGRPCLETVERLVDEACHRPPPSPDPKTR
jgi:hypothetical protein